MIHGLIHADGPSPADPADARTLGYEERKLGELLASGDAFRFYVHATSVPELVSYVRGVGRDCEYRPFATSQALLIVAARSGGDPR